MRQAVCTAAQVILQLGLSQPHLKAAACVGTGRSISRSIAGQTRQKLRQTGHFKVAPPLLEIVTNCRPSALQRLCPQVCLIVPSTSQCGMQQVSDIIDAPFSIRRCLLRASLHLQVGVHRFSRQCHRCTILVHKKSLANAASSKSELFITCKGVFGSF